MPAVPPETPSADRVPKAQNGWKLFADPNGYIRNPPSLAAAIIYVASALIIFVMLYQAVEAGHTIITARNLTPRIAAEHARGTLTIIGTFFAALVALVFAYWRARIADNQNQALHKAHATQQETYLTGLIAKAVEYLGQTREWREIKIKKTISSETGKEEAVHESTEKIRDPVEEQQRGAIQILGRAARDSEKDTWPIASILAAYYRSCDAIIKNLTAKVDYPGVVSSEERSDFDLRIKSARRLANAALAQISEATRNSRDRPIAALDLSGDLEFVPETLRALWIRHANLDQMNCIRKGEKLVADFRLDHCSMRDCRMSELSFVFQNADEPARFDWSQVDITRGNFTRSTFTSAKLKNITFTNSQLKSAIFERSIFVDCNFTDADAFGADFINCIFRNCDFTAFRLEGAKFEDCNLSGVLNMAPHQIDGLFGDYRTKLPDKLELRDAHCLKENAQAEDLALFQQERNKYLNPEKKETVDDLNKILGEISPGFDISAPIQENAPES